MAVGEPEVHVAGSAGGDAPPPGEYRTGTKSASPTSRSRIRAPRKGSSDAGSASIGALAMQKVEGSSPFIRLLVKAPPRRGSHVLARPLAAEKSRSSSGVSSQGARDAATDVTSPSRTAASRSADPAS
jgi:hypothetical protein